VSLANLISYSNRECQWERWELAIIHRFGTVSNVKLKGQKNVLLDEEKKSSSLIKLKLPSPHDRTQLHHRKGQDEDQEGSCHQVGH
jgi:hypothetical protein